MGFLNRRNSKKTGSIGGLLRFSLLFLALSGLGLYAVYSQVSGATVVWDPGLLKPSFLLGVLALLLIYFAMDGLRLWFVLGALHYRVPLTAMARLVFINIFVSNVTPLATGGGVAQVWFLQRRGVPIGTAMTATTVRTVLAILFIFGAALVDFIVTGGAPSVLPARVLRTTLPLLAFGYLFFFAVLIFRPKSRSSCCCGYSDWSGALTF